MSTRIPPSLKWLIDKRARLDAEIKKTDASLAKAKVLIKELAALKKDLKAIDHTLSLHEIQVDLALIQPVKTNHKRVDLPHGELTRCILECLRKNSGTRPVPKSEIDSFILSRHPHLASGHEQRVQLYQSIHSRLKNLAAEGVIQRHHNLVTCTEGLWSLPRISKEK